MRIKRSQPCERSTRVSGVPLLVCSVRKGAGLVPRLTLANSRLLGSSKAYYELVYRPELAGSCDSLRRRKLVSLFGDRISAHAPKEPFELCVDIPGKFQIAALDRRTGKLDST